MAALERQYRRDRTEGQEYQVWLGVEKSGMVEQLESWFDDLGVPIIALGGYGSQTYKDNIRRAVHRDGRPAALLYAGDHDPSGEDIYRSFIERTKCWDTETLIALTAEQVEEYDLPINPGKEDDPRAAGFIEKHGELWSRSNWTPWIPVTFTVFTRRPWMSSGIRRWPTRCWRRKKPIRAAAAAAQDLDDDDEDDES